jgi:hypothetical protein
MKKIIFVVQLCFITSILTAQITRQQADDVVYEYIQQEVTRPYYLATNDDFPDENGKTTIVTSKEETFSVDYPCWIYYVDEWSDVNGPHPCVCLFVNKKDGDYLEVKIKKSFITDLENWRIMHTPWGQQLQVNIGNDTTFCSDMNQLSPFLSVKGGTPPYKYCWSIATPYYIGSSKDGPYYASNCLSDTTLANPIISAFDKGWFTFILSVEDMEGNTGIDSINIRYPDFYGCYPGYENPIFVAKGDSVLFDVSDFILGGILPYSNYIWNPKEGLSDPDSSITWCKPEKAYTDYTFEVTDSVGCKYRSCDGYYFIVSHETSIPELSSEESLIYELGGTIFFDNPGNKTVLLSFYDSSGKLIHEAKTNANNYRPPVNNTGAIVICKIKNDNKQQTLKYIVQ